MKEKSERGSGGYRSTDPSGKSRGGQTAKGEGKGGKGPKRRCFQTVKESSQASGEDEFWVQQKKAGSAGKPASAQLTQICEGDRAARSRVKKKKIALGK